jgi:hypothetical protein
MRVSALVTPFMWRCALNSSQNVAANEQYRFIDCREVEEFQFIPARNRCRRSSVAASAAAAATVFIGVCLCMDAAHYFWCVCAWGVNSNAPTSHTLLTSELCPTKGTISFEMLTYFLLNDLLLAVSHDRSLNFRWLLSVTVVSDVRIL